MLKKALLLCCLFSIISLQSQELNCKIIVNADQIPGSNKQVFSTLEKSLNEFVNQKQWTNRSVKPQERINCAMTIIVTTWDANRFEASIQVQSTRPVFNTSYASPILNIKDDAFSFRYNEFDQLIFNPTRYDSNLISTIAFYVHIILGADADTFSLNGGQAYYKAAENVMLLAQQSGISAWSNVVGTQNRFMLIDNLLSPNLRDYRIIAYNYHRNGLDRMSKEPNKAKQTIEDNLIAMQRLLNKTVSNYLLRVFFDAKSDEIINLFSDGKQTRSFNRLLDVLPKVSPNNANKWRKLN